MLFSANLLIGFICHFQKHNTMKKFFAIMAIIGFMAACNNETDSDGTDLDTTRLDTLPTPPVYDTGMQTTDTLRTMSQ